MRRVPQKAVLRTEYPFCTGNACFLHRMPLKMRRVPQEAFLSTARIFRTIEGPLRYRMPLSQKGEWYCLQRVSQIPKRRKHCRYRMPQKPKMRRALPATSITNTKKEKSIACNEYHKAKNEKALPAASITKPERRRLPASNATTARKEEASAKSVARLIGEKQKENDIKIVLFPIWGAMWGSNPRHPEPQSGALPTELIAPCQFGVTKVQRFFGIAREYSKKELSLCDWNKNRIREYVKRD